MNKQVESGHVKVLMSVQYNNFEASRPLPPDATDDDYREAFDKTTQLVQEAVDKYRATTDIQRQFYQLCEEYIYVSRTGEAIRKRIKEGGEPASEVEGALLGRLERLETFCLQEYISAFEWEHRLYDAMANSLDAEDKSLF